MLFNMWWCLQVASICLSKDWFIVFIVFIQVIYPHDTHSSRGPSWTPPSLRRGKAVWRRMLLDRATTLENVFIVVIFPYFSPTILTLRISLALSRFPITFKKEINLRQWFLHLSVHWGITCGDLKKYRFPTSEILIQ